MSYLSHISKANVNENVFPMSSFNTRDSNDDMYATEVISHDAVLNVGSLSDICSMNLISRNLTVFRLYS